MAVFNFRQGIARCQTDGFNNNAFLQPSNGGNFVDFIATPEPTIFILSHDTADYMITEQVSISKAWGPFTSNTDHWLYWDVDFITGELTRGFTTVSPVLIGNKPSSPIIDQHWFDSTSKTFKVWSGTSWVEKLRCFAAKYQSRSTIVYYQNGSQVGINVPKVLAGHILFDPDGNPLQQFDRSRRGIFITSETPLHSQFNRLSNIRLEGTVHLVEAYENIPIFSVISYFEFDKAVFADAMDPDTAAVGIAIEDMNTGDIRPYTTKGYITNHDGWDWSNIKAGSPVFVGLNGSLSTTPVAGGYVQQVGVIVNRDTILLDIRAPIRPATTNSNPSPMSIDISSGNLFFGGEIVAGGGGSSVCHKPQLPAGVVKCTWGYSFIQPSPSTTWTIVHNFNCLDYNIHIQDQSGNKIVPNNISSSNVNTIVVNFGEAVSGKANIVFLTQ